MSEEEAVRELDAMDDGYDQEIAHGDADEILLKFVPKSVADAFERCRERVGFWYA
jgi:hypothetical protein